MGDKTARVILGYQIQESEIARAIAANQQVKQSVLDSMDAIKSAAVVAGDVSGIERLKASFEDFDQRIQGANASIADQRQELLALASQADKTASSVKILGDSDAGQDSGLGNVSRIHRAGGALSAIGATELGRGLSVAGDIGQLSKLPEIIGQIPPPVLGAGVAVAGLTVAVDLYTKAQQAAAAATKEEIDGRERALELLQTGTAEEIQTRINELQKNKEIAQATADDTAKLFGDLRKGIYDQLGSAALASQDALATIGKASGAFQQAHDSADAAQAGLNKYNTELSILEQATGKTAQTTDQAAQAEQRLNLTRQYGARIQAEAGQALELLNLAATGTQKQVEDLIAQKRREIQVYQIYGKIAQDDADAQYDKTKSLQDQSEGYKQASASATFFNNSIQSDRQALLELTNQTLDHAKANDKAAQSAKIAADSTDSIIKFNADVQKVNQDRYQKEIDLWGKLTDKQVEIANKAVEDEQHALDQLLTKEASLRMDLARSLSDQNAKFSFDALQDQIKFNRREVEAAQAARDKIEDIQRESANQLFEDGLSRNFAQLAADKRAEAQKIVQVNVSAQRDQATRLKAFQDQQADQQAAFVFDRQQKLIQYQRDIEDSQKAEQAQLAAIEKEKAKQLNAAKSAYDKEYAALEQASDNQVRALEVGEQQKLQVIAGGQAGEAQLILQYASEVKGALAGIFDIPQSAASVIGSPLAFGGSPASQKILGAAPQGGLGSASLGGSRAPDYSVLMGRSSTSSSVTHVMNFSPVINANGLNAKEAEALAVKVSNSITAQAIRAMTRKS